MKPRVAPILAPLLLLLLACHCVAAGRVLLEKQSTSYSTIMNAVNNEVWLMKQLSNGEFKGKICLSCWASNKEFLDLSTLANNPKAPATLFMPGSAEAWQALADANCLSLEKWLDELIGSPDMAAAYLKSFVVPGFVLNSSNFEDGKVLPTMQHTAAGTKLKLTLGRKLINGTLQWVLKNASAFRDPETGLYKDIIILPGQTDIKAGAAWFHQIDSALRIDELQDFWHARRAEVLTSAGYPANSTVCPPAPAKGLTPAEIAGIVIAAVAFAVLVCCGAWLLLVVRRRRRQRGLLGPLCGDICGDQSKGSHGTNPTQPMLAAPDSRDGTSSDTTPHSARNSHIRVNAVGSSSCAASYSSRQGSSNSLSSAGGAQVGQQLTQLQLQGSMMPSDSSPFAVCAFSSQEGTVPAYPQTGSVSSCTAHRTSSGRWGVSSSSGSGPTTSGSSGGGCDDVVPPLRDARSPREDDLNARCDSGSVGPACNSYAGPLHPTHSVPMGQIPHALVIPFAELRLQEVIGAGAEGKVFRGTWKHTEIAAKQYLAVTPCDNDTHTAQDTNRPPSEAAEATAQAALAKEVHWLTSLNHPNLVRFCAVCLERPFVVMEFYRHGSVFDMMRKAYVELNAYQDAAEQQLYCSYLNWDRRLEMLHDVAAGMSYLHGRNHIHGDLRSPNLFVGADGKVKIGDFGFTKRLACNRASLRVARITHPRWVAPELLMHNILSRESDVYSFGIIMYELLTFRVPFEQLRKEQVVLEVVRGSRPELPHDQDLPPGTSSSTCLWGYRRLMQECWAQDAAQRPSFEAIARRLKAMQRWRMVIGSLRPISEAPSVSRTHSMPAPSAAADTGRAEESRQEPVRRTASAPAPDGNVQSPPPPPPLSRSAMQHTSLAAVLRGELPRPTLPPPLPSPLPPQLQPLHTRQWRAIPSIPEVEVEGGDAGGVQVLEEPPLQPAGTDSMSSLPVSSAVVQGTQLAIISLPAQQDEHDALHSVVDPGQIAEARRVLMVASDLPSHYHTWRPA